MSLATGTIRRFLDKYKNETVILCLEAHERGIYEVLAPLYFPRDILEESSALWQLPRDIGGSFGEPQITERQIRIIHNPQHSVMINGEFCFCLFASACLHRPRAVVVEDYQTQLLQLSSNR